MTVAPFSLAAPTLSSLSPTMTTSAWSSSLPVLTSSTCAARTTTRCGAGGVAGVWANAVANSATHASSRRRIFIFGLRRERRAIIYLRLLARERIGDAGEEGLRTVAEVEVKVGVAHQPDLAQMEQQHGDAAGAAFLDEQIALRGRQRVTDDDQVPACRAELQQRFRHAGRRDDRVPG